MGSDTQLKKFLNSVSALHRDSGFKSEDDSFNSSGDQTPETIEEEELEEEIEEEEQIHSKNKNI